MKERFEGSDNPAVTDGLKRQDLANGNAEVVSALKAVGELTAFSKDEILIEADGSDRDVFFILAGKVSVTVKGREVRTLSAGDHVGEMAAVEPSQPRAARVLAAETVIAWKVKGDKFIETCDRFPEMYKPIAQALARRLFDRNRLMAEPNQKPRLFVISSVEALDVANAIQAGLERDAVCAVWRDGVFWTSGYPLESLERAVSRSDFAVAVAQFEDTVQIRGETHRSVRDNVLFELGIFMGQLGRHRTFLVHPRLPNLRLPSDLHGLTPASYNLGDDNDLQARLGPACTEIRNAIRRQGVRTS